MKKIILYITIALVVSALAIGGTVMANASTTTYQSVSVSAGSSALDTTEIFTDRDSEQTADLTDANYISLVSNQDVSITEAGVYVLSGDAENVTITVSSDDDAKVQLVLDGVNVTNQDAPVIYVESADKVFITTTDSENTMEVTGEYTADGETNLDAVIFAKDDLVLNGVGALEIVSAKGNGISSKDDLKVTGGTYVITAMLDGLESEDSIAVSGGTFTISANRDALHSEDEDDLTVGYIYISGGEFNITAGDDGIRATTVLQIDGGTINISSSTEGMEATYIQINDGDITVYATDDGINAAAKTNMTVGIEVNGGIMDVSVGSGDTDAFDANGNIIINGGTINVTANSSFDADGTATLNGGTVTVNGQVITEITQQMGGMGGGGGNMGGGGRPGR